MAHLSNHRPVDRVRVFGQRYTLLSANSGSRIHHDRPGKKKSEKRRSARLRSGRQTQTQRKATNRRSGIEAAYSEYPGAHRLASKRSTDISVIVIDSVRLRAGIYSRSARNQEEFGRARYHHHNGERALQKKNDLVRNRRSMSTTTCPRSDVAKMLGCFRRTHDVRHQRHALTIRTS
jgi:hypothetical protein